MKCLIIDETTGATILEAMVVEDTEGIVVIEAEDGEIAIMVEADSIVLVDSDKEDDQDSSEGDETIDDSMSEAVSSRRVL